MNIIFTRMAERLKKSGAELEGLAALDDIDEVAKYEILLKFHEIKEILKILESMLVDDSKKEKTMHQLLSG